MSLGPFEIALIFLVILLLFGAKRIPEIARGMGKGIREFKDATADVKRELTVDDTPPPRRGIEAPPATQPRADASAQQAAPVKPDIEQEGSR
ncbi:MAG: twin-arginine translocase TatA/TatE family subunit [Bacteroidota bacterium]